jgi:hypothetical protein
LLKNVITKTRKDKNTKNKHEKLHGTIAEWFDWKMIVFFVFSLFRVFVIKNSVACHSLSKWRFCVVVSDFGNYGEIADCSGSRGSFLFSAPHPCLQAVDKPMASPGQ